MEKYKKLYKVIFKNLFTQLGMFQLVLRLIDWIFSYGSIEGLANSSAPPSFLPAHSQ